MIARAAAPLAYVLAGPLADRVFEPLLSAGGPLAGSVGQLMGTGAGRGIGLLFVIMGIIKIAVVLVSCSDSHIRYVEDELPDALPAHPEALGHTGM